MKCATAVVSFELHALVKVRSHETVQAQGRQLDHRGPRIVGFTTVASALLLDPAKGVCPIEWLDQPLRKERPISKLDQPVAIAWSVDRKTVIFR